MGTRLVLLVFFVLSLVGCTRTVYFHPKNVIAFNRNGIPVSLPSGRPINGSPAKQFTPMSAGEYDRHVTQIFSNYSSWRAAKKKADPNADAAIAVVIHGGLNTYAGSLTHLDGLFERPSDTEKAIDENDGNGRGLDASEYPLSIIWNAGAWDALGDRYKRVRNGVASSSTRWNSGLLFAGDAFLISPAQLPMNYFATYLPSWWASYDTNNKIVQVFEDAKKDKEYGCEYHGSIKDRERAATTAGRILEDLWILPLSALVQGIGMEPGRWSYYMMQRHVERMFQIDQHDVVDGEDTAEDFADRYYTADKPTYPDLPVVGNGPLGVFVRHLRQYQKKNPDVTVNVYAHSMGTIVADNMVARSLGFTYKKTGKSTVDIGSECDPTTEQCTVPGVKYGKIVFMSGADTIRNWQKAVWPYLLSNTNTVFYNFTLNPINEYREQNYIMPRGSLLIWIDDYLVPERDRLDRTVGRLENLLAFPHEVPWQIKDRVRVVTFPATGVSCVDNNYRNCDEPQVHSDTFRLEFWNPEKYLTKKQGKESLGAVKMITVDMLKKSLPDSQLVVGFDIDDTVLFSSPGFYYAATNTDGPGGKNKYGERPLKDPTFWRDLNMEYDKFSIPKEVGKVLVKMHKERGDKLVFISSRTCGEEDRKVLENRLKNTFNLCNATTICTNEQSKTPAMQASGLDIYYGDSDTDIENARAVPDHVKKVRPIRVQRSALSTNSTLQGYNPGQFSEEILVHSEN